MEIAVYGPLRSATGAKRVTIDFDGETVGDAIDRFVDSYPRGAGHLYDDEGALRASVRVQRNGDGCDVDDPCTDADELSLFPAMRGG